MANLRKKVISAIIGTAALGTVVAAALTANLPINNQNDASNMSNYETSSAVSQENSAMSNIEFSSNISGTISKKEESSEETESKTEKVNEDSDTAGGKVVSKYTTDNGIEVIITTTTSSSAPTIPTAK